MQDPGHGGSKGCRVWCMFRLLRVTPNPRDPGFKVWGVRSRWHLPDLQSQGF